jgi:hypothetical protein
MKPEGPARRLSDTVLFAGVATTVFLISITVIALAFLRPGDMFRSSARIKLDFRLMESGYNPEVLRSELPKITSDSVLRQVTEQLQLTNIFPATSTGALSANETVERLKRIVVVRPLPNSMLIEIQVLFGDSAKAADIANAVADAYRKELLNRAIQTASSPLLEFESRKRESSDALQTARLTLQQMEVTNAPADLLAKQRSALAEAEKLRNNAARELESATREFTIPKNTLQAVLVDSAIPAVRPVQTHRRRVLTVGLSGAVALGISAGALAVVIRRSRGTTRFTPPKRM